jgi:transposase
VRKIERQISDEQWEHIRWYLPEPKKMGRPRCDDRSVLEGILWVLRTGARWRDMPPEFPSPSTCWRRLVEWEELGVWEKLWESFLKQLDDEQIIDWEEAFVDASFFPAKKGATQSARPSAERVQSAWWWSTARVFLSHAGLRARVPRK